MIRVEETDRDSSTSGGGPPPNKKGKFFFLSLIILSGIAVFSLLFLEFEGDKVTIYMIDKFVLDRGVLAREMSDDIPPEEREEILHELRNFFESAKAGFESMDKVAMIGGKLREIMADGRVTREEIGELRRALK